MSHIGKRIIKIPRNVFIDLNNKLHYISIKGPLGFLELNYPNILNISISENKLKIIPLHETYLWGTYRTLINNAILGVSQGFTIKLELIGIGYRASILNNLLHLKIGLSHDITIEIPQNITISCIKPTLISVTGINKQQVFQMASNIRSYCPPEPYKGKGIRYENEHIILKKGKKK